MCKKKYFFQHSEVVFLFYQCFFANYFCFQISCLASVVSFLQQWVQVRISVVSDIFMNTLTFVKISICSNGSG